MARLERIDIIEGASLTETQDGYEAIRVAWVDELTGRADERLYNAVRAAAVPQYGDPHPSIPGLRVVQRSAALEKGSDRVLITLTYRVPQANEAPPSDPSGNTSAGVVRVGSTVQGGTTQKDIFGDAITVKHKFPGNPEFETQGADVELSIPQLVLSETRKERSTPANTARAFVGKVNQFAIFGGAARTLLCTRIEGTTQDGGLTYEVTYEFQFNEQTWDATVVFRDTNTGRPVENPVNNQGIKTVRVYREVNFAALGLSL
ncbi:MAG: hypothetical protein ACRDFA_10935 [bacterium]